ncbi:ARM repeat-containing protein [Pluteus cervinus]|uniref:ARM repeat-containing protein n=1 Tax=Pluteus cervinus TaxID=181527 RepID=A0ACD3BBF0_9AGAR|nr:ARM repeat-containing protein [Pluteus cervinus]
MEATERLVRTWMASGRDEEVNDLVAAIESDQTTLLNLVKALGEYLTSEEDKDRTKGVELLSAVIKKCPAEKLNRQSVRVLTTFYCSKLDDIHTIIPALQGLHSLSGSPNFTSVEATTVVKGFFSHVTMKALTQSVRFVVYSTIDTIIANHREALKGLDTEFINGYLALADGEKDPRNLLVAFAIERVIILEFDISKHVESFYNITFAYFPITFRPPPNDPYGITSEDLREALRGCLTATPLFGIMAMDLFLEKLNAGSPAIKRDTLQTLAICFPVYGPATAHSFSRKLWNSLKLEIFQPVDAETQGEALKAFKVLIDTLYSEETVDIIDLTGLAKDACEECIQILKEPEKTQAKHAIKVLCTFVATTPSVAKYAISQTVPHLVQLFRSPDEVLTRPATVVLLAEVITASRDVSKLQNSDTDTLLGPFQDDILAVLAAGLKVSGSEKGALQGLLPLASAPSVLSDEEIGFVVHCITEFIQASVDSAVSSRDEALELLGTISGSNHQHVSSQTLPILFSSLPDHPPPRDDSASRQKYWLSLQSLKKLCRHSELFETLVIRLTTKLDLIWPTTFESETEPAAAYAHAILKTLGQTLSIKVEQRHPDVAKYVDRLLPRLFNLVLSTVLSTPDRRVDQRILDVTAQIITLVVQVLPPSRQQSYANNAFGALLTGNINQIANGHKIIPEGVKFHPLDKSASANQKDLILLFGAAVVPIEEEVSIPVPDLSQFLQSLVVWHYSHADEEAQKIAVEHMIASIVNKHVDQLQDFLTANLNAFWQQEIQDPSKTLSHRQRAIVTWSWISKALVVRSHPLANDFIDHLFDLFGEEGINWAAAKALGQIGSGDEVLTKKNHCIVKVLHAQRYVAKVLPRIIAGAKDANERTRQTAHLVALTSLIKSIPRAAYAQELPSLIPLLLRGLELPDPEIRVNVIGTFQAAAEGDPSEQSIVEEHALTLVSSMLKNCMVDQMPAMPVRIAALKYLGVLPSIVRYNILHPQKSHVVRELGKVLDDPKRVVRKEAVDARFTYSG